MGCVLPKCLDDSVPPSSPCPSPPYRGSSWAAPAAIASIEEGDSRDSVEDTVKNCDRESLENLVVEYASTIFLNQNCTKELLRKQLIEGLPTLHDK